MNNPCTTLLRLAELLLIGLFVFLALVYGAATVANLRGLNF